MVRYRLFLLPLATLLFASTARAQCGSFCIYEVGSPQMGSSYAGAGASAEDAATAFLNPAGMTRLDKAEYLQGFYAAIFDLEFESNRSGTTPAPGGFTNDGGNAGSFLPGVGSYAVIPLSERLRFGMALNGIFGGAVDYRGSWIGRTFITEIELQILNLQPGFAYRVNDWLSLGASANILRAELGKFRLEGPTGTLKADGANDWAGSFTLSALLEPRKGTRVGVVYRHKADLTLKGGKASGFRYDFDLPGGVNVSLHHDATDRLALLLDGGWSNWSNFDQNSVVLGPVDVTFARKWRDTWRIAGGAMYRLGDNWLLRGGVSYDSSPVSDGNRTPDLPMSEQYRFSGGLQYDFTENLTVGGSYTLTWWGDPKIERNALAPPPSGVVLDGKYQPSFGHFIGLTFRYKFCSPLPWVECPGGESTGDRDS